MNNRFIWYINYLRNKKLFSSLSFLSLTLILLSLTLASLLTNNFSLIKKAQEEKSASIYKSNLNLSNWNISGNSKVVPSVSGLSIEAQKDEGITQVVKFTSGKPVVISVNFKVNQGSAVLSFGPKRRIIEGGEWQPITLLNSAEEAKITNTISFLSGSSSSSFEVDKLEIKELDMTKGKMLKDEIGKSTLKTDDKAKLSTSTTPISQTIPVIIGFSMQVVANHCDSIDPLTNRCPLIEQLAMRDFAAAQNIFNSTTKRLSFVSFDQPWDQTKEQGCGVVSGGQFISSKSCNHSSNEAYVNILHLYGSRISGGAAWPEAPSPFFAYIAPVKDSGTDYWQTPGSYAQQVFSHEMGHILGVQDLDFVEIAGNSLFPAGNNKSGTVWDDFMYHSTNYPIVSDYTKNIINLYSFPSGWPGNSWSFQARRLILKKPDGQLITSGNYQIYLGRHPENHQIGTILDSPTFQGQLIGEMWPIQLLQQDSVDTAGFISVSSSGKLYQGKYDLIDLSTVYFHGGDALTVIMEEVPCESPESRNQCVANVGEQTYCGDILGGRIDRQFACNTGRVCCVIAGPTPTPCFCPLPLRTFSKLKTLSGQKLTADDCCPTQTPIPTQAALSPTPTIVRIRPTNTPIPPTPTPTLPQFGSCGQCLSGLNGCTPPEQCVTWNDPTKCRNNGFSNPCCLVDEGCKPSTVRHCGWGSTWNCERCHSKEMNCNWDSTCGGQPPYIPRVKSPIIGSTGVTLQWYAYGEESRDCNEQGDVRGIGCANWPVQGQGQYSCWGFTCARGSFNVFSNERHYYVYVKGPNDSSFTQKCDIANIPDPASCQGLPVYTRCAFTPAISGQYQWYVSAGFVIPLDGELPYTSHQDSAISTFNYIVPTNTPTPTFTPVTWTVASQPICPSGKTPKPMRMFRILWPGPNGDFDCTNTSLNSGSQSMSITSRNPVSLVYVGMEVPERGGVSANCSEGISFQPITINPASSTVTFGKYMNPYNWMANWTTRNLPSGSYSLRFVIPNEYCE